MSVRILQGNCLDVLRTLPDASVHCCVTSPPYWGLRDYGTEPVPWPAVSYEPMPGLGHAVEVQAGHASLGLEPTIAEFLGHMVAVFREVRRVLRDDGTCWVNMGDSYCSTDKWGGGKGGNTGKQTVADDGSVPSWAVRQKRPAMVGVKPKDMMGQPWRLAFALQADGWWLRQDIIWHKPNPMPESTRDRCTKAHEYVFLLAKSERYAYDFEAMQEPVNGGAHARLPGNKQPAKGAQAYLDGDDRHRTKVGLAAYADRQRAKYKTPDGWDTRRGEGGHGAFHALGREKGTILPEGVGRRDGPPGNPPERKLAEAGSGTKNNTSMDASLAVMPDTRNKRSVWTVATEPFKEAHFATFPPALIEPCIKAGCPVGGTVLDPFGGAGTTGLVADRLQRDALLIELNPAYAGIARRRIASDAPLFAEVAS